MLQKLYFPSVESTYLIKMKYFVLISAAVIKNTHEKIQQCVRCLVSNKVRCPGPWKVRKRGWYYRLCCNAIPVWPSKAESFQVHLNGSWSRLDFRTCGWRKAELGAAFPQLLCSELHSLP